MKYDLDSFVGKSSEHKTIIGYSLVAYGSKSKRWELQLRCNHCGKITRSTPTKAMDALNVPCQCTKFNPEDWMGKVFDDREVIGYGKKFCGEITKTYLELKCLKCGRIRYAQPCHIRSGLLTSCYCKVNRKVS